MKKYRKFTVSLIIMIGLILIALTPYGNTLAITFEDRGEVIGYVDHVDEGFRFHILYTHSVHKTPVKESYKVNANNEIIQTELAYENFAIGMPSNAEGEEEFVEKDGVYYIKNMNRVFPSIDVRIGQVIANHTLIMNDEKFPMKKIIEPGSWVRLNVQPLNLWQRLKGDEIFG